MSAMTNVAEPGPRVDLRDEAGRVKVFLPGEVVSELTVERDRLRKELSQLREEMETLRSAKQAVENERNQYLRGLRAVMEQDLGLSEQSWVEVMRNGIPGAAFFEGLEESFDESAGREKNG
jgi:hypothetical protein